MRRACVLVCFALLCLAGFAQARIEFEKSVHDFGSFSEDETFVYYSFKFKNAGNSPLIIVNAKATCGCTVPEYSKAPIAPGDSGVINVKYSAIGRPGYFDKSIKIITNGVPTETSLVIKGNVIGSTNSKEYKYFLNGLKLKTITYDMGNIVKGNEKTLSFETWNGTDRPLTINISNVADYMKVKAIPQILSPGEKGVINVIYNSNLCNEWGPQIDEFLITSERPNSRASIKKITILSNITEDFSKQGNKHPKAEIEKVLVNMGEINGLNPVNGKIKISNSGNANLIIRKVSSSSPVIKTEFNQGEIKKGKEAYISYGVNPVKSKSKIINEKIILITNDPKRPEIEIQITAILK